MKTVFIHSNFLHLYGFVQIFSTYVKLYVKQSVEYEDDGGKEKSITAIRPKQEGIYLIYCQRAKQKILTIDRCIMNYSMHHMNTIFHCRPNGYVCVQIARVMKIPIPIWCSTTIDNKNYLR